MRSSCLLLFLDRGLFGLVLADRYPHGQRAHAFGERFHGQKGLADVGMDNQWVRRLVRIFRALEITALQAFARIQKSALVRDFG